MKILVVEDEEHIAMGLRFNLEAEGYQVEVVEDGDAALTILAKTKFDVVVLDVMLPTVSGFDVAHAMRERSDYTPILMLTARSRPEDVLLGFAAGADDYLPKPFDLNIFLARLHGLLRRSRWSSDAGAAAAGSQERNILEINGRIADLDNLELRQGDEVTRLTLMEAKLIEYLYEHAGRTVSRKAILEEVWQLQEDTDTRAIDNFVVRLRKLLEDEPNNPRIVQTVRGIGYRFVLPGS